MTPREKFSGLLVDLLKEIYVTNHHDTYLTNLGIPKVQL